MTISILLNIDFIRISMEVGTINLPGMFFFIHEHLVENLLVNTERSIINVNVYE